MTPQTLKLSVQSSEKVCAEIIWTLHCCMNGVSNNSNKEINDLFQEMFPDSDIVKLFEMGPNKLGYIVSYGLGPFLKRY